MTDFFSFVHLMEQVSKHGGVFIHYAFQIMELQEAVKRSLGHDTV
jgi:hypothetical protein